MLREAAYPVPKKLIQQMVLLVLMALLLLPGGAPFAGSTESRSR